jgi:homoserine O-succinyltransferase/O-acetyltransferase
MIVALVNNMPDSAFIDTEDQFRRAIAAAPGGHTIELALYTIKEIPRPAKLAPAIQIRYRGLDQLWSHPPDALIVTGTEPAQVQLSYEAYWPYLAHLLEWATRSVPTTLLSCLAAHASVLLFDGIERVPRAVKCSGVYPAAVEDASEPLTRGLPEVLPVPHSRVNDLPEQAMLDAGYRIVIGAGGSESGWAVAARERGDGLFVLCQGHPEYATLSLLREYRRDVRRCLFGRGAVPYPRVPDGYLSPGAVATLEEFERRTETAAADPRKLWASFPFDDVAAGVENTWSATSALFHANWLGLARATPPASPAAA